MTTLPPVVFDAYNGWTVTLDPGGFVVRDRDGRAVEVFHAKHKATARALELSTSQTETSPLFEPAPNVPPGQLAF